MQIVKQPLWLRKRIASGPDFAFTKSVLAEFGINTVCQDARCPNIFECFSKKTATFLILGNLCTRRCAFCCVQKGRPLAPDADEPNRVAEAASVLGLRHIVVTSVTRDDLPDGGSGEFARTIDTLRKRMNEKVEIEVLVPDFKGNEIAIKNVVDAGPDVFSHNLETVPSLYQKIRPDANYRLSIEVLRFAKGCNPGLTVKSGFMLGLGETEEEVISVMKDLREANCDELAIGQYLRPSIEQVEVREFIKPSEFLKFERIGYSLGFNVVKSGPFIRSSYR